MGRQPDNSRAICTVEWHSPREIYSPDQKRRLIYPVDSKGIQQVGYEDLDSGEVKSLANFPKGVTYDAAWSPDGNYIAFVSTERAIQMKYGY